MVAHGRQTGRRPLASRAHMAGARASGALAGLGYARALVASIASSMLSVCKGAEGDRRDTRLLAVVARTEARPRGAAAGRPCDCKGPAGRAAAGTTLRPATAGAGNQMSSRPPSRGSAWRRAARRVSCRTSGRTPPAARVRAEARPWAGVPVTSDGEWAWPIGTSHRMICTQRIHPRTPAGDEHAQSRSRFCEREAPKSLRRSWEKRSVGGIKFGDGTFAAHTSLFL